MREDVQEVEAQAEEIEVADAACQAPESSGAGGGGYGAAGSKLGKPPRQLKRGGSSRGAGQQLSGEQLKRLSGFCEWASDEVLLELSRQSTSSSKEAICSGGSSAPSTTAAAEADTNSSSISAGFLECAWPAVLSSREVAAVCFPPDEAGVEEVCVAYRPVPQPPDKALQEHSLPGCGLLVVWERKGSTSSQPLPTPAALLMCEAAPVACCYGMRACSSVVVAATEDGAICAWDLQQRAHRSIGSAPTFKTSEQGTAVELTARWPSFSSEAAAILQEDLLVHLPSLEPLIAIAAVPPSRHAAASSSSGWRDGGRSGGGGSCSLVVLGVWGRVSMWTMKLLGAAEAPVAEADPGVQPGGCYASSNGWGWRW